MAIGPEVTFFFIYNLQADGLLRRMLGNTEASEDRATDVTRQPRWRKVEPLAKSYLGNTLHILGEQALHHLCVPCYFA